MNSRLSIVVPCFNEEQNIRVLYQQVKSLNIDVEVLFVDDGSTDETWQTVLSLESTEKLEVVGIQFTKNFGKEAAIEAGLRKCKGDIIVTMDSDLQHPVELIPKMIQLWERNQDIHIVNAIKRNRQKESLFKRLMVSMYYAVFRICTGINLENHSDFKLIDRKALIEYLKLDEKNKFFRGLTTWLGFNSIDIEFEPKLRQQGEDSWSIFSLIRYAKSSILSFSYLPLKLISFLGVLSIVFSLILTVDTVIKKINGTSAEGFPTIILLQLGMGSILLFSIGVVAEYLAEIYKELKKRPSFIINKEQRKDDE